MHPDKDPFISIFLYRDTVMWTKLHLYRKSIFRGVHNSLWKPIYSFAPCEESLNM